jgi:hypothetical protein
MRSRLEARFAAWLDDGDGCEWTYEPRAFANERGQYLPDFAVDWPGTGRAYIEVRPTMDGAYRAMSQMPIIWDSEPSATLLICFWDQDLWWYSRSSDRTWHIHPVHK